MTPAFRPARPEDLAAIAALNDTAIPHVNALAAEVWLRFIAGEARVRVATDPGGGLAALTVTLPPGRDYGSENYAWFQRKLTDFAYVDRIVVAAGRRGLGIGRAAYGDIFAAVGGAGTPVVCEVNLFPANDGSLAFHGGLGFREIAVQSVYGGSKRVAMLARRADGVAEPSLPGPDDLARLRRAPWARPGTVGVLAEDEGGAELGRVAAAPVADGGGVLTELHVVPDRRGYGLGARLLAAARREARTLDWRALAAPGADAARFLARNGFVSAGEVRRLDLD
jgi:predicted GNAT superfamily acetyltransferase